MDKETRIKKIREIKSNESSVVASTEIKWKDQLQLMHVYKVPLEYLVYNGYNGRILSRTESFVQQKREIDPETEEGKKQIEKLLWKSDEDSNKKTEEDIKENGQMRPGIITLDGIIIDGNRRAMLLNKIHRHDYFKAVILDVNSDENPREIEKLETFYQMGEDEKLNYNSIEKYLKVKRLIKEKKVSEDDIARWMKEKKSTIKKYLSIMKTMDDYLSYLGYQNLYTQLDEREGQLKDLTEWKKKFYGHSNAKGFFGYNDLDVEDLITIAFDYIQAKYEGKEFRELKGFFGDKEIWKSFKDRHFKEIKPIRDKEKPINLDSENLKATLDARDKKFKDEVWDFLRENLADHQRKISYKEYKNKPLKVVNMSHEALNSVRSNKDIDEEVLNKVEDVIKIAREISRKKSPKRLLKEALEIILSADISGKHGEKKELLEYTKEIQKETYNLEKRVKSLKE